MKKPNADTTHVANPIDIAPYIKQYRSQKHELKLFMESVANWFGEHPELNKEPLPIVHSIKSRLKSEDHLRSKIRRKYIEDGRVRFSPDNLSKVVTDLSGVRVMHLHQSQFERIHELFTAKIATGDWFLAQSQAFTWDPESADYFRKFNFVPEVRSTFYTSVHYTIRPREDSLPVCEIQIRTLFEEIWGEVDHALNYPIQTKISTCAEQLRVLSKLVGAGSRLLDSIFLSKHGKHRE